LASRSGAILGPAFSNNTRNCVRCPGGWRRRPPLRPHQSLHRARRFTRWLRTALLRPHPGRPRATAQASLLGTAVAR